MRTLVIIPTYNERDNLPALVRALLGSGADINVLVVDDSSPDGTGDLADALARNTERIHVLDRERGTSKMSARIALEAAVLVLRFALGISRPPLALRPGSGHVDLLEETAS